MRKNMSEMYEGVCDTLRMAGYDAGLASDHLYVEHVCSDKQDCYFFVDGDDMQSLRLLYEATLRRLSECPTEAVQAVRDQTVLKQAAEEILGDCNNLNACDLVFNEDGVRLRITEPNSVGIEYDASTLSGLKYAVCMLEGVLQDECSERAGEPTRMLEAFLATEPADVADCMLSASY